MQYHYASLAGLVRIRSCSEGEPCCVCRHVQGAVAIKGEGLYEGLDWLSSTLKSMQRAGTITSVNAMGR